MTRRANGSEAEERPQRVLGDLRPVLGSQFELSIERRPKTQYYHMQTQFIHIGFDGQRTAVETYLLRLRVNPSSRPGESLDEYTCREFGLQIDGGPISTLPALSSFSYRFDPLSGVLHPGPFFGIPQAPFAGLKDGSGKQLPSEICYAVYNNFVDFHALSDVFPRPMKLVKGIEQLRYLGDRVVHPGAFTEAPIGLDGVVRSGSVFRNGELALELKGVSLVDDRPCALVNYDSGESTLRMTFLRAGDEDLMMEGGSEYTGDIYIDLDSGWIRKVTLDEFVVTQTHTPNFPTKVPGYTARHILLRAITQQDFETSVAPLSGLSTG